MAEKLKTKLKNLPDSPGVYIFKNASGKIIYIGKAINLKRRVGSYFLNSLCHGLKTKLLIENIYDLEVIEVDSEIEALLLEANLININKPKYNVDLKDNKAYPYIKISINEPFPRIYQTRTIDNDKARYFGPYPDVVTLKFILKYLRRMFMFRTCKSLPQKPCLFYDIGKCQGPCIFKTELQKNTYRKYVKNITLFLEGKKDLVVKNLNQSMNEAISKENFEYANELKKQIEKIRLFTKPQISTFEYLKNPDLLEDQLKESTEDLLNVLKSYFPDLNSLNRIECYDIATIQGKFSSSSMIVFNDGQKNSDEYRKFKIKNEGRPNDYQMLEETLKRRFSHSEWKFPDLVIVDGGKGQLTSAQKIITLIGLNIPIISLAKREEEVFLFKNQIFTKLRLERSGQALKLLQRLRDEAHRFATSYHKKLRERFLTNLI